MEFKHIAVLMTFTLLVLLICSKWYVKKFKAVSVLEAKYFEAMRNFKLNQGDLETLKSVAREYFAVLGVKEEEIEHRIEIDLK